MSELQSYWERYKSLSVAKRLSGDEAERAVKRNGYALQHVSQQTEAVCLEAVKQNGYALQYVSQQTEAVCLEAVKRNGYALQHVS